MTKLKQPRREAKKSRKAVATSVDKINASLPGLGRQRKSQSRVFFDQRPPSTNDEQLAE